MGLSRITVLLAALALAMPLSGAAWAAACITPKTAGEVVPYTSPPKGVSFIYKITYNPNSKTPDISHRRYRVKSITDDKVRWFREPVQGKGPIQDVTLYRAFATVAAGGGWSFEFDVARYDALWPLQQGKEVEYVAEAVQDGKLQYKQRLQFCVRGSKVLKLQAGDFQGYLVDISSTLFDADKKRPWDRFESNVWYVPQFGTALLMEDRFYLKDKVVLAQRREVIEVTVPAPVASPKLTGDKGADEPPPPNFQFPGLNDPK